MAIDVPKKIHSLKQGLNLFLSTIYPHWTLKHFNLTLSLHLSGCRASYKIFKKLISPNTHTKYLKYFYFRIYCSVQCAVLISIYTSNYQWKISSLTADEFLIKSYHHHILKKIKIFLCRKVYLGVRGTWKWICKEQDKPVC